MGTSALEAEALFQGLTVNEWALRIRLGSDWLQRFILLPASEMGPWLGFLDADAKLLREWGFAKWWSQSLSGNSFMAPLSRDFRDSVTVQLSTAEPRKPMGPLAKTQGPFISWSIHPEWVAAAQALLWQHLQLDPRPPIPTRRACWSQAKLHLGM